MNNTNDYSMSCRQLIDAYMSSSKRTEGNLEYDNFSYGYFKYINKNDPSNVCVFDTLNNEFGTSVRTNCAGKKEEKTYNYLNGRNDAIRDICKTIGRKQLNISEVSYMIHYYDDHYDK